MGKFGRSFVSIFCALSIVAEAQPNVPCYVLLETSKVDIPRDFAEGKRAFLPEERNQALDTTTLQNLEIRTLILDYFKTFSPSPLGRMRLSHLITHPYLDSEYIRQRQAAAQMIADNDRLYADLEKFFTGIAKILEKFTSPTGCSSGACSRPDGEQTAAYFNLYRNIYSSVGSRKELFFQSIKSGFPWLAAGTFGLYGYLGNGLFLTEYVAPVLFLMAYAGRIVSTHAQQPLLRPLSYAFSEQDLLADLNGLDNPVLKQLGNILSLTERDDSDQSLAPAIAWLTKSYDYRLTYFMFKDLMQIAPLLHAQAHNELADKRGLFAAYMAALADLESLFAAAKFFRTQRESLTWPQILSGKSPYLEISDGHHPYQVFLKKNSIANSLELTADIDQGDKALVLTGPNSGGKTTFLRMIGLNVLLAQIGFPVPARQMALTPMHLATNFNVIDSTAEGRSTFKSQALRVAEIAASLETGEPHLLLMDEILKGTSQDQHEIAERVMLSHFLKAPNAVSVLATHNRDLSDLANCLPGVGNIQVADSGYQVLAGRSTCHNAFNVMGEEGLPASVLNRGREILRSRQGGPQ